MRPPPSSTSFITRTLEQQRKEIERSEISQQAQPNDTDDEIEHGMQHVKSRLAQQFEEKHSKKGKGKGKQRQDASEEDEEEGEDQQAEDDGSDFDRMSLDDALPAPARGNKGKSTARGGAAKGKSKSLVSVSYPSQEVLPFARLLPIAHLHSSTKHRMRRMRKRKRQQGRRHQPRKPRRAPRRAQAESVALPREAQRLQRPNPSSTLHRRGVRQVERLPEPRQPEAERRRGTKQALIPTAKASDLLVA